MVTGTETILLVSCGVAFIWCLIGGTREVYGMCKTEVKKHLFKHVDKHKAVYNYIEVSE